MEVAKWGAWKNYAKSGAAGKVKNYGPGEKLQKKGKSRTRKEVSPN